MMERIIGFLLAAAVIVAGMFFGGGMGMFLDLPSLVYVVGLALGLSLFSEGWEGTRSRLKTGEGIRRMISSLYAAGAIGTMNGVIAIFARLEEFSGNLLAPFSVALLTLFYAMIISEVCLRPLAHRRESEA